MYEAETIHAWLDEHGAVCPMSGAPLTAAELQPDDALKRRIHEHHIRATLANQAKADEEADLYAFN